MLLFFSMLFLKKKKYLLEKKLKFYLFIHSKDFNDLVKQKKQNFKKRLELLQNNSKILIKKKTYFIKVLSTNRNIIIGLFSYTNKLYFLLTMGLIKNQNNLKKKSLFACNILLRSLFLTKLYKKNLLRFTNNYVLIFLGSGKIYKFIYKSFLKHKLNFKYIIQKNNFPHNGCFKKKKKRR